jgi:hypothetical protein
MAEVPTERLKLKETRFLSPSTLILVCFDHVVSVIVKRLCFESFLARAAWPLVTSAIYSWQPIHTMAPPTVVRGQS